jgi:hypothetical protein
MVRLIHFRRAEDSTFLDLSVTSGGVNGQKRIGNVDSILAHAEVHSSSILYSLNTPSVGDGGNAVSPDEAISTDLSAFRATVYRRYCGISHPYPFTSMRWYSFALKHSVSMFSWSPEGLGTYFKVVSGIQVLYVAEPISEGYLADISCYIASNFDQEIPNSKAWKLKGQVLKAGSIW